MKYRAKEFKVEKVNRKVTHETLNRAAIKKEVIEDCIELIADLKRDPVIDVLTAYQALEAAIATLKLQK